MKIFEVSVFLDIGKEYFSLLYGALKILAGLALIFFGWSSPRDRGSMSLFMIGQLLFLFGLFSFFKLNYLITDNIRLIAREGVWYNDRKWIQELCLIVSFTVLIFLPAWRFCFAEFFIKLLAFSSIALILFQIVEIISFHDTDWLFDPSLMGVLSPARLVELISLLFCLGTLYFLKKKRAAQKEELPGKK